MAKSRTLVIQPNYDLETDGIFAWEHGERLPYYFSCKVPENMSLHEAIEYAVDHCSDVTGWCIHTVVKYFWADEV
jgi:hypothetical protein